MKLCITGDVEAFLECGEPQSVPGCETTVLVLSLCLLLLHFVFCLLCAYHVRPQSQPPAQKSSNELLNAATSKATLLDASDPPRFWLHKTGLEKHTRL